MQLAEKIRPTVDKYTQAFPALLEIPSKDHPYGELPLQYRLSWWFMLTLVRSKQRLDTEARAKALRRMIIHSMTFARCHNESSEGVYDSNKRRRNDTRTIINSR